MKKLFLFLTIAVFALSAVSCEGPEGPPGRDVNAFIQPFTVQSSAWILTTSEDGLSSYYEFSFSIPKLTQYVYDKGDVNAYRDFGNSQVKLNTTNHYRDIDEGIFWSETVSYEFGVGEITFRVTYSDFQPIPPVTMNFRVVLTW